MFCLSIHHQSTFGLINLLAIWRNAAMNMGIQVSVHIPAFRLHFMPCNQESTFSIYMGLRNQNSWNVLAYLEFAIALGLGLSWVLPEQA